MKKIFSAILCLVMIAGLSSCAEESGKYARVDVVVEDARGIPFGNTGVYMFVDGRPKSSDNTAYAAAHTVTDNNGVANFMLDLKQANVVESRSNIYFSVFYEVNDRRYVATPSAVTLRRGSEQKVVVRIPVNI